jgi:ElaA protein
MDWRPFEQLTPRQVHDLLQLRSRVFVVEQACVFLDADGLDPRCVHGLCTRDGVLVATARLVPPGLKHALPAIGRVVTAPEARRTGLGRALMAAALSEVGRRYPGQGVYLSAQRHLEGFYASLGFRTSGAPYDEDGIPHVDMLWARHSATPSGPSP